MLFKRLPTRPPRTAPGKAPELPYGVSTQIEAHVVRQAERHAQVYLACFLAALALVALFAVLWAWQSTRMTFVVRYVEVDTQGTVRAIGTAGETYVPRDEVIAAQIKRFLTAVRGLPLGPKDLKLNWDWAFGVVTQRGAERLAAYAREHHPEAGLGKKTVTVRITRALKRTDNSWDVSWQEEEEPLGETKVATTFYSAIVNVLVRAPTTDRELAANALGIWIDYWQLTSQ